MYRSCSFTKGRSIALVYLLHKLHLYTVNYMKCKLALISGFPFQILSHSCRVILDMQEKFVLTYHPETLVADHQGDGTLV